MIKVTVEAKSTTVQMIAQAEPSIKYDFPAQAKAK